MCKLNGGRSSVIYIRSTPGRICMSALITPVRYQLTRCLLPSFPTASGKTVHLVGCNLFMPKPIDTNELLSVLQTNLNLTWLYDETLPPPATPVKAGTDEPLTPPPPEELAALAQLAAIGDLRAIRLRAGQLEQQTSSFLLSPTTCAWTIPSPTSPPFTPTSTCWIRLSATLPIMLSNLLLRAAR
jgi:hypothetical protein